MSLEFGSLRVFVCNYVFYSFGLILRYFFRFLHLGDAKKELIDPPPPPQPQADGTEWRRFHNSQIDGFPEELANFLFWSGDLHEGNVEREGETECSAFKDTVPEGNTEFSVSKETHSDIHEDCMKPEVHSESSVSKEIEPDMYEDCIEEDGFVFMESGSFNFVVHENGEKNGGEIEKFVSMETDSDVHEDEKKKNEDETQGFVFTENGSDLYHSNVKKEDEEEEEAIRRPAIVDMDSNVHEDERRIDENETESSIFKKKIFGVIEDGKKVDQNETKISDFKDDDSNFHHDSEKMDEIETESSVFSDGFNLHGDSKREEEEKEEEEETEGPVFLEKDTVTTTSKCEYLSGKDISCFMEEPTTLRFSFREFYMSPDVSAVTDDAHPYPGTISNKVFSGLDSEKDSVAQEETEDSILSNDIPFLFESEAFGGTDSSDDEDYFLFNENSVTSDSESESSSSSGLIWGNTNKIDDSVSYQFLGGKNGFESEILNLMMRGEVTDGVEEKQSSFDDKVSKFGVYSENGYVEMKPGMKGLKPFKDQKEGSYHEEMACRDGKTEKHRWEEELGESESDEDDFEWEHDDLVEQLKMELKNSRQGGLATILEEEEEEELEKEDETESPNLVEDLKPLKIEEKLEYKDQIDEIEKVYKRYAEKMRKLDILNYQTMHALGLLQLKDPLKLISLPKSSIQSAKPIISHNLWPLKATKITSDPLLKLVHELHRDLELVYVGQICLSWDILCWQHKKALELQQYDSQGSRRYNTVAGEFQLFQVLMQRFIENEPFQGGPRLQNFVKNRCVIRNLLQVPAIKDDSKGGEEDAIASGRLADIIKESMRVFWEFVRADKDYGNMIPKVSKQIGADLKDPTISGLLVDIKTQLQKKERKLKDIVRSGNCIVKKFQKHHEDQLDHEQLVAQVGLRLISRVVSMSHLRKEQVLWCNEKLHRIKFLSRKIVQVEPSFVLFPC